MLEIDNILENAYSGYESAQSHFHGQLQSSEGSVEQITSGTGLDVLMDAKPNKQGIRPVNVEARKLGEQPELMGRALLWFDVQRELYVPTVIVPSRHSATAIRISRMSNPFVPEVGLTRGLQFGLAVEANTQAPGFGSRQHNGSAMFEPGHVSNWLAAGASQSHARQLLARGDERSHEVIDDGVPSELDEVGLLPANFPLAKPVELNLASLPPGAVLPLYWPESFQTADGAAKADFDRVIDLLLGTCFNSMSGKQIDQASSLMDMAVRRGA